MPESDTGYFPSATRRLTNTERESYATHLSRLAVEFDDHCTRLRSSSDRDVPIAAMRAAMSRAGDLLVALLGYGEIAAPRDLPPWLRWRAEPDETIEFRGWEGSPTHSRWTPTPDVDYVLRTLSAIMHVSQRGCVGHSYGSDTTPILDRLIFVEAVGGWLGTRCTPPPKLALPTAVVIVGPKAAEPRGDDIRVQVTVDWDGRETPQVALLFMELGPACSMVCRHLADAVRAAIHQKSVAPSTGPDGAVIAAYEQAKDAWLRRVRCTPKVGNEPGRVMVLLDDQTASFSGSTEVETDPHRDGASLVLMLTHPGGAQFEHLSIALANACYDLADLFERRLADGTPCRQLAAQLSDLPRRPLPHHWDQIATIDHMVRILPDPAPDATSNFHSVMVETAALATRIVKLTGDSLPAWHLHLHRNTPEKFAACRRQVRNAESALIYPRFDLAGLPDGAMSTLTHHRLYDARQRSRADGLRVEAEIRAELEEQIATLTRILQRAQAEVAATDLALEGWKSREKQRWIERDMRKLRQVLPRFRALVAEHRLAITAVADTKNIKLGQLSADYGSNCEALEIFAIEVLRIQSAAHFNNVDPDQLRIGAEREIGLVLATHHHASEPSQVVPSRSQPVATTDESLGKANKPDPAEQVQVNRFYRKGDYWEVGFGESRALIKGTTGMDYLAQLLDKRGVPIHSWMLRHGEEPPVVTPDEMTDSVTIDAAKKRMAELEQLLGLAGNPEVHDELEADLMKLREYLQSTEVRKRGPKRGRPVSNELTLNRDTVGKAILAAIAAIKKQIPELGIHLEAHVRSPRAMAPAYTPPQDTPTWYVAA